MIGKLEVYCISALLMGGAVAGAYFYAKHQGVTEERARWETKAAAATKADLESLTGAVRAGNKIAQETQDAVNRNKGNKIIDRGVIEREIQTNTLYSADCLPATGLVQWNRLSQGLRLVPAEPAGAKPDAAVPKGNGAAGGGLQKRDAAAQPPGR